MLEVKVKKAYAEFNLDVEFSVNQEILAILGPSGSGKTMTLQCIAGLLHPDEGYIRLNDRVLLDSAKKIKLPTQTRGVGFVFQNYALFPHLKVEDNIAYGIKHLTKSRIADKVKELLDKMHLADLGQRYPRQLSAGQQQRVALARAIAPEPQVLLLDEPFSALDAQVKERLELELLNLQDFYKGNILFVTHNLAEGYKLASKIAVYESGRIVQCDSKNRVIECPANRIVARLTGVRNLMRGTVETVGNGEARINVPELAGTVTVRAETEGLAPGQEVTIGIRPEFIHIIDQPRENAFLCKASRVVEGVSLVNCFFQTKTPATEGHWIEVSLHKAHAPLIDEGHEGYIYLPPEHIAIIRE